MSLTTRCDLCGKCAPEVTIKRKRKVNWFLCSWGYDYTESKYDLCDECWASWEAFVKNRVKYS